VNDVRVARAHVLRSGDVVSFGEAGPRVEIAIRADDESAAAARPAASAPPAPPSPAPSPAEPLTTAPRPARRDTTERIAMAVGEHTRTLRRALAVLSALLVIAVAAAYWMGHREVQARSAELRALSRANDSLARVYAERVATLAGRVDGLDSSLAASVAERDALRRALASGRSGRSAGGAHADSLAAELRALESRRHAMLTAAQVDYSRIAERNGGAVTLIAVEWGDGTMFSGSGFCVRSDGAIVTNRHLVARPGGERPTRIAVIFSDTKAWLPAHVVTVSDAADLALIQVDAEGPFPAVAGVAPSAAGTPVGKSVAIIGYPLGTDTPMEGSGTRITARSSLVAGTVSKNLPTVLQIDAYAGEGSSGSPVFDTAGNVVGVVYGGARESGGRIVYAVPSDAVGQIITR
jgi:S1-C subfamily serine protease